MPLCASKRGWFCPASHLFLPDSSALCYLLEFCLAEMLKTLISNLQAYHFSWVCLLFSIFLHQNASTYFGVIPVAAPSVSLLSPKNFGYLPWLLFQCQSQDFSCTISAPCNLGLSASDLISLHPPTHIPHSSQSSDFIAPFVCLSCTHFCTVFHAAHVPGTVFSISANLQLCINYI